MTSTPLVTLQKSDAKYDLIKFFLSLLVLAIHSKLFPMVLYPWLRIAVPLFFMMSSYFVFSKLHNASKNEQKQIFKKFIIRNVQLYFCWFIILLPITLHIQEKAYFSRDFLPNTLIIIRSILFGNSFTASWYIPATVIGVLLIYFLSNFLKKDFIVFLISLLSFCIVTLASSYMSNIEGTVISSAINFYIYIFGGVVLSFPASLLWVFMGKMFAEQKIRFQSLPLLICLTLFSCVGLFAEWKWVISLNGSYNNDSYFMLAPLCILLFIGIQRIKPFHWKHSVHFRSASTVIYVSHGSLVFMISEYMSKVPNIHVPLLSYGITFLLCVVIYAIITAVIGKCRSQRVQKILKMLY